MEKNLTTGAPSAVILNYSLPVIGGNLFQLFYTMADSIIVGRTIGANGLAAVGATNIIVYLILCLIQGITGGFGIVIGQAYGSGNQTDVKKSMVSSFRLCVIFTVLVTGASCLLSRQILGWLNTPAEIETMAYNYVIIIFAGTLATVFYNWISNVLRALGDSKTPLMFLIFSSLLNIALDLLFLVPLHSGIAGAAIATVFSQLLSAILCGIYAFKKYDILRPSKKELAIDKHITFKNLSLGLPMGLQMSVMCIGLIIMQSSINNIGTAAITGYTAANKVDQMSVLINGAFGIAISNYVAQNYGAGLFQRIRKGVFYCLIYTEAVNIIIGAILLVARPLIVPLFVSNPTTEIVNYSNAYLNIVIPFYLLLGILQIYRSSVQSMGNSLIPFIACIVELVLRTTCTLIAAKYFGYQGICFSIPLAWIGAGSLVTVTYYWMMRRFNNRPIPPVQAKVVGL